MQNAFKTICHWADFFYFFGPKLPSLQKICAHYTYDSYRSNSLEELTIVPLAIIEAQREMLQARMYFFYFAKIKKIN